MVGATFQVGANLCFCEHNIARVGDLVVDGRCPVRPNIQKLEHMRFI